MAGTDTAHSLTMRSLSANVPTNSLFSRVRPGKATSKKLRGFMALPGEIRNRVYHYYFQSDFRCEIAASGHTFARPKPRTVKLSPGVTLYNNQTSKYKTQPQQDAAVIIRLSRRLGKYSLVKGLQTNWITSIFSLHLVCKLVYAETLAYIYHKTTYVFAAPRRIADFLGLVSKSTLEHITKLELHYNTYGNPGHAEDCIWQDKHIESWTRACKVTSKRLTRLKKLEIWVHVNHGAPKFNFREKWLQPMLEFRRLTRQKKHCGSDEAAKDNDTPRHVALEFVNVHFSTRLSGYGYFANPDLARASNALHVLFGRAISCAILGAKEHEAMLEFNDAWEGKYSEWKFHLGIAQTGW
ncbi:hypothetical protein P153DRAFT_362949 [Dothidotthia symphoricarpi CBS 119687]|uniref:DUF7730 domain-containing protein n=1 Tax=Dothidotthia symphoricarpi CBS 119687 TaxID=1392245 RepID=A0A6A6AST3_9PLEO|nr:uncharacterized protein P153DRAFT_362949 [Dothidotthia symphoricarpi CBS 119687]KAF2133917.1 hypothetical protein P153DRAFT_362949 [Dothidotthia symphoricarpi CBS 119687]